ncbi:hypothetical protein LYSHEL_23360 [Lysobacter helvus]|uniref:DUF7336 domain-containing protein n=2 Tax=Lysobacteraceae TaxID=32033 RepID=A0ABN6FUD9_9GAMM|nr:hypothetical protein LYSCAS_23360 [Lysobacter caseinilyticus]BCT96465.1 hypothetical protein LYSHEL_23360 [Lysobacter helvus]
MNTRNENTVYLLSHANPGKLQDDEKILGVFSSAEKANQAIAGYLLLPGFREQQDGFHVDAYVVDQQEWSEGFG